MSRFSLLPRRSVWLLLVLLAVTAQTGCMRRRMTVRSNPPGAVVFVDERRIGVTPVSTSFIYYGTRDVRVMKDGYETVNEEHKFTTPWYQYPVIDFFSENLWPFEVRDERILDFDLPPQKVVPPTQVIQSAEQLRNEAQRGLVTPMVKPAHQYLDLLHRKP
ncbi:MAG: PEGA domain-containing protein [Pirellulaceae bacterium]